MSFRMPGRYGGLLVGLVLMIAPAVVPAAAQATIKPYTVGITPASIAAGTRATLSVHVANPVGAQQQVGSVRLTAPTGIALVPGSAALSGAGAVNVAGGVVTLTDLALQPGTAVDLTVVADIPCTSGVLTWLVAAKQANAFNGPPGNDLTLVPPSSLTTSVTGQCALRFATQPANARTGEAITAAPYAPGAAVAVEVVDGAGTRVTGSTAPVSLTASGGSGVLSGGGPLDAVLGLASFPALTLSAPGQYTLRATSPGLADATSVSFRIDDAATVCAEDVTCTGSTSTPRTRADVTAVQTPTGLDAGVLTLSFNSGLAVDCAGYTETSPDTVLLDFTSLNRTKTATLTIDKKQMALIPNNGASFLQLCFGSPVPFVTSAGGAATPQGTYDWNGDGAPDPVFVGLLPDCTNAPTGPCVTGRKKVGAGDGQIAAFIPAGLGDPGMRG